MILSAPAIGRAAGLPESGDKPLRRGAARLTANPLIDIDEGVSPTPTAAFYVDCVCSRW
jgi:hypothetical protein